jgi:hypothetical protein
MVGEVVKKSFSEEEMTTTIKVKRSTGRYSPDNYNLHIYKSKPHSGWNLVDAARNMDQVKSMITSQPPGCAIAVKNRDGGEFKYDIYTLESLLRRRWEEEKKGVRFV